MLDTNSPLFQRNLLESARPLINPKPTPPPPTPSQSWSKSAFHSIALISEASKFQEPINPTGSSTLLSFNFQGADLTGVNPAQSWLIEADLSDARMEGVRFGELPYLELDTMVATCTYSPDGSMLALGLRSTYVDVYETTYWTKIHQLKGHTNAIQDCAFSPNNQHIVSGSWDGTVRVWDIVSGEALLVMKGHSNAVLSVAFSPCVSQTASSRKDETIL
jgi:WD40 repeat protein